MSIFKTNKELDSTIAVVGVFFAFLSICATIITLAFKSLQVPDTVVTIFESCDSTLQYKTLNSMPTEAIVGIESQEGLTGVAYPTNDLANLKAVLLTYSLSVSEYTHDSLGNLSAVTDPLSNRKVFMELERDALSSTETYFALQSDIGANSNSETAGNHSYYVYYGQSNEEGSPRGCFRASTRKGGHSGNTHAQRPQCHVYR